MTSFIVPPPARVIVAAVVLALALATPARGQTSPPKSGPNACGAGTSKPCPDSHSTVKGQGTPTGAESAGTVEVSSKPDGCSIAHRPCPTSSPWAPALALCLGALLRRRMGDRR